MDVDKLNDLSEKGKKVFDQVKKGAQDKLKKIKDLKKDAIDKNRAK